MMIRLLLLTVILAFVPTLANAQAPAAPSLRSKNSWMGQNYQSGICPLADAQTIVVPVGGPCPGNTPNYTYGLGMFSVTLTGAGHTLSFTGVKDTGWILLKINHGAGPYNPLLPGGTLTPGAAQPTWTNAINSVDDLVCYGVGGSPPSFDSTAVECTNGPSGLAAIVGAPTGPGYVRHDNASPFTGNATSFTSAPFAAVGVSNSVAGFVEYNRNASSVSAVTLGGGTCGVVGNQVLSSTMATAMFSCYNITGSPTTLTVTVAISTTTLDGGTPSRVVMDEFSGITSTNTAVGPNFVSSANPSISITPSASNIAMWTYLVPTATASGAPTGFTLTDNNSDGNFTYTAYQLGVAAGTTTIQWPDASNLAANIGAVALH